MSGVYVRFVYLKNLINGLLENLLNIILAETLFVSEEKGRTGGYVQTTPQVFHNILGLEI